MRAKRLTITNCKACPHCDTERTKGAGYALDYVCKAAGRQLIAGYVEWSAEEPKDGAFPDFCPLPNARVKTA